MSKGGHEETRPPLELGWAAPALEAVHLPTQAPTLTGQQFQPLEPFPAIGASGRHLVHLGAQEVYV